MTGSKELIHRLLSGQGIFFYSETGFGLGMDKGFVLNLVTSCVVIFLVLCLPYVSQHYWKKKSVGTFCIEVHPNNHLYWLGTANVT